MEEGGAHASPGPPYEGGWAGYKGRSERSLEHAESGKSLPDRGARTAERAEASPPHPPNKPAIKLAIQPKRGEGRCADWPHLEVIDAPPLSAGLWPQSRQPSSPSQGKEINTPAKPTSHRDG
jgi:hypothetical protein